MGIILLNGTNRLACDKCGIIADEGDSHARAGFYMWAECSQITNAKLFCELCAPPVIQMVKDYTGI